MKIRSVWLGMFVGLCTYKIEAAEKRQEEGWPTQIFNRLSVFWEQNSDQGIDFTKNDSLEPVEKLIEKQHQLKREIVGLTQSQRISREHTPLEALYNVLREQQKEIEKKTYEYNSLTSQIAQKMNVPGDSLRPEAQVRKEGRKS